MSEPKYYPILFTGEMVRAILDGRKTQTRRLVKLPDGYCIQRCNDGELYSIHEGEIGEAEPFGDSTPLRKKCPYGQPGDRLWVRETWRTISTGMTSKRVEFRADGAVAEPHFDNEKESWPRWRPSIFMPRWASRITLEVTGVRVERVRDISEADAIAEGIVEFPKGRKMGPVADLVNTLGPVAAAGILDARIRATAKPTYGLPEWKPEERQPTARAAFLHLFYGLRKRAPKTRGCGSLSSRSLSIPRGSA